MTGFARRLAVLSFAFAATALLAGAGAASAHGSLLGLCDNSTLTQPFLPWADPAQYKLAPGGDFEGSLGGWSLTGGASVLGGSESFGVTGSVGSSSLGLPSGASATSPQTCVTAAYPDFRFFARTSSPGATVRVTVEYQTVLGTVTVPVGVVAPTGSWEPTAPMATGSAIPGTLNGGTAWVSLVFTASGGTAQIDDVYVDPKGTCC